MALNPFALEDTAMTPYAGTPDDEWEVIVPNRILLEQVMHVGSILRPKIGACEQLAMTVVMPTGGLWFSHELFKWLPPRSHEPRLYVAKSQDSDDGQVRIPYDDVGEDVRGRDIFMVEDLVDSGKTASLAITDMYDRGAKSVTFCTLVDKPDGRKPEFKDFKPDYSCVVVHGEPYIAGCSLDGGDKYIYARNFQEIRAKSGIVDPAYTICRYY